MVDHRITSLLAGIFAIAGVHGVQAQESGGVRINGNLTSVTTVKGADNIARGSNARAYMSVGSVGAGVTVNGNLKVHVDADRITNQADGANETAVTSIGSVHKGAKAAGEIIVHTGDVTNVSDGSGDASCVIIGSKGHIPECDQ
ncbi:MAG: hypothetical protein ACR2QJ_12110 [Geminicoccaceae bacterium]